MTAFFLLDQLQEATLGSRRRRSEHQLVSSMGCASVSPGGSRKSYLTNEPVRKLCPSR